MNVENIKQEPEPFLDLSIVKEEFTIEELDEPDYHLIAKPLAVSKVKIVPVKFEDIENEKATSDPKPDKKKYTCKICGKVYVNSKFLRYHRNSHDPKKIFKCPQCPAKFAKKNYVQQHMFVHEKVSPATCQICNKTFKTDSKLKNHLYRHDYFFQKRTHTCKICRKVYISESEVEYHIKAEHERHLHLNLSYFAV
ncbi:putative zinc finger protein 702 isoform X2 [Phlebotomus papatasi]|uniref:putative zinc finger protein 702 isoform X2 n=1 Tax=Phlebotomus papatasi TaxID=29031 RepID=UPI0024836430|nr:putative zinc finger protein 702 isoform X2 [Phlebotomus papatasi]